jgi:hypothetical protein
VEAEKLKEALTIPADTPTGSPVAAPAPAAADAPPEAPVGPAEAAEPTVSRSDEKPVEAK